MKILVTGVAGFIGFHLANRLAKKNHSVIGIDNLNKLYYEDLKYGRLVESGFAVKHITEGEKIKSKKYSNYQFIKLDIRDEKNICQLFENEKFDIVCHLAAHAGVRLSLSQPRSYIESNINGFINILEASKNSKIKHLCYASSSSVYGLNDSVPYSTGNNTDHPISVYAVTKKTDELLAHSYSHLYNLPTTGLRFFSVYGPWGRPDMAYFKFVKDILNNKTIDIYNNGHLKRDFTYIDDIINIMEKLLFQPASKNTEWSGKNPDPGSSLCPYKIYNIGNNSPVNLLDFIQTIEKELGIEALKRFLPMQAGDVNTTWADVEDLVDNFDYKPNTNISEGIRNFVNWYKKYYDIKP
ncbi:NAD-dependent epimerase/dehydratase family protein [Bacteroidota bacterium]